MDSDKIEQLKKLSPALLLHPGQTLWRIVEEPASLVQEILQEISLTESGWALKLHDCYYSIWHYEDTIFDDKFAAEKKFNLIHRIPGEPVKEPFCNGCPVICALDSLHEIIREQRELLKQPNILQGAKFSMSHTGNETQIEFYCGAGLYTGYGRTPGEAILHLNKLFQEISETESREGNNDETK